MPEIDSATLEHLKTCRSKERREKLRFPLRREVRYKLFRNGRIAETGTGETVDIGSSGISFEPDSGLPAGVFIELSVSWPVLLDQSCPMQLHIFGRVIRSEAGRCACMIQKWEFRTQSRGLALVRNDSQLQRWAENAGKGGAPSEPKLRLATA
jgi:hypothetical protein